MRGREDDEHPVAGGRGQPAVGLDVAPPAAFRTDVRGRDGERRLGSVVARRFGHTVEVPAQRSLKRRGPVRVGAAGVSRRTFGQGGQLGRARVPHRGEAGVDQEPGVAERGGHVAGRVPDRDLPRGAGQRRPQVARVLLPVEADETRNQRRRDDQRDRRIAHRVPDEQPRLLVQRGRHDVQVVAQARQRGCHSSSRNHAMLGGMWRLISGKDQIPSASEALPGRAEKMPVAARHFVNGAPLEAPFPDGPAAGDVRNGVLLGRRAEVLGAGRRLQHGRRVRGRPDAQPDLPRGLLGPNRPRRGGASGLRSAPRQLRAALEGLLGEPRPDAGDAARKRRR